MTTIPGNEIIKLAGELIALPTVQGNDQAMQDCVDLVSNYLDRSKFQVDHFESNGVKSLVITPIGVTGPIVFFNAHFDVVPAPVELFQMQSSDGRLSGRGSLDMKSQLAALLVLFRQLALSPQLPSLGLMLVGDEEQGGYNGTKYILAQSRYQCRFVIAAEPSDLRIANEAKGILQLQLTARGKTAHSARPWQGDNAITRLARVITEISADYPVPSAELNNQKTTYVFSQIDGGKAPNQVPGLAQAVVNIRYVVTDEPEQILKTLRQRYGEEIEFTVMMQEAAAFCSPENSDLALLRQSATKVLGREPALVAKAAGSDIRHFSALGIPGIVFGPTGGGSAHSDAEWINLDSLFQFYEVLDDFVRRL